MRNYARVLVALSILAIGCGGKGDSKAQAAFTVLGSPTGEVDGAVRIVVAFSKAMVQADAIGKPVTTSPLTLSPEFAHEAKWADDKTLVVVATTSLPVSTKYVATVPATIKALDGTALGKAHVFEFFTERITGALEIAGSKERAAKDQNVKLTFNQEVAFDAIAKSCELASATKQLSVKLAPDSKSGPAKSFTIIPAAELALDSDWRITCRAGLRGVVGNIGTDKPLEEKFHTYGPLRFSGMKPSGTDIVPDENLRLELAFSNPLKPPYKMTLSPPVKGFPERCHELGEPPGITCASMLDARTSYTLTVDASQEDVFGQKLGKPETLAFRTTDAQPTISVESGYFVAELKRAVLPVWTRNVSELQVTAVAVTPGNFHELSPLLDWWEPKPIDFSKTRLKPTTKPMPVTGTKNQWGQHPLDPTQLVGGTPGPGMYYIEIGSKEIDRSPYTDGGRQKVLVNFTDIGVVSKISGTRGIVWATQLSTGKPLPGAQVTVRDDDGKLTFSGTTDADGVAVLPGSNKLARASSEEERREREMRVFVQKDADWTMVNPTRTGGLSTWAFNVDVDYSRAPTRLRGFMHTDRGLYRPGEKVHVKGIARVTKLGEPLTVPSASRKVKVEVDGPQGKSVMDTEAKLSAFGGFWFDLDLPADARLGDYTIRAELESGTFTRTFSVEEYRPATFEVTGKAKEPQIVGRGDLHATISANYLYGAPVRSGNVDVTVHSRPRRVHFDQHEGFEFLDERKYDRWRYYDEQSQSLVAEDSVAIDANGNANVAISISPNDVYGDADLLMRANVTSPSNEVISKTFTIPYYSSKQYFGIKSDRYFLDVKKPAKFKLVAASANGKLVDAPAKVKVTRRDWNCVWEDWGYRGSYQCKDTTQTIMEKQIALSATSPADIEFTPPQGGDYWIVVEGQNDKQEAAAAAINVYAWGDGGGSWYSSDALKFDIVADKTEYKAGDTATLILKTDLAEATGLVTIERDGVIEKRLVQITPTMKHVTVPITANYAPNVYVSVALVQGRKGDGDRGKPRMRMGVANLTVRPEDNRLTVTVETDRKDYRPGDTVTATVKVTDAAGKPASAEVSITAADEGVLSLIGYETPDPVPTFYAPWGLGVTSATQMEYLRDIPGPNVERPATGGDAAGSIRSRFVSTAVWSPGAVTNGAGVATVTFKAPDNLTAFRMMAVAADGGYRFGSADKRFTVSKPLQLHQALPRFLNQGDTLQGGVVVHNETGKDGTATVKLVADRLVTVAGATERTVTVPKGGRVPVLFELAAADLGTSALTFSATLNGESDAVKLELPITHPSPIRTQDVAAAASKDAVKIPLTLPADAIPGTIELAISVDPDGLAGIEDGLRELIGYPYGCLEQTTSKVIPMLAVRELAESLAIDGMTGPKLEEFVKAGIAKIGRHQTPYGGFSLWPGGEPEAYYTAYALWGLHLAKQAGYAVDKQRIEDGLQYLREDAQNPDTSKPYYDVHGDAGSQAFAVYVRAILGDKAATADATKLVADLNMPLYGRAFLARALAAGLGAKDPAVTKLVAELSGVAATATKAGKLIEDEDGGYDLDFYMSSDVRTSAMVLAALVEIDPKNASIKPLAQIVMKKRREADYWDTQENLYALVALTSYARTVSAASASVKIELGGNSILSGTLAGKQRVRVVSVPLTAGGELAITPKGEVSYNVQVRFRQKPETVKAESAGMTVGYEYLDETGKPRTTFTVGDVVVVRITSDSKDDATHLMLSHRIPAGFEILNTRLATVGTAGVKQRQHWGAYREMHDDRVDLAFDWASSGKKVNEFSMRAIAAGKFARPPTVGERMYEPAIRSQTAFDMIEVKAK
jgi:alpha-2-macroglobulin